MFSKREMSDLVNSTITTIHKLRDLKGREYAGDTDALANFRRNGLALGMSMESVWAVYAAKHWDAIQQYIKDANAGIFRTRLEPISGRADDLIVYLILFKAILQEQEGMALNGTPEAPQEQGLDKGLSGLSASQNREP